MIVLDTNVVVEILKERPEALEWLAAQSPKKRVVLPGFVVLELVQGANSRAEVKRIREGIRGMSVVWPRTKSLANSEHLLAEVRGRCAAEGMDALIAATAIELGQPLWTFDSDFTHFRGLRVETPVFSRRRKVKRSEF